MTHDNVIPFKPPPQDDPKCSFCGKRKSKVRHLFSNGADKHICDECVGHAKQRLKDAA